jgi:hypothetical protein
MRYPRLLSSAILALLAGIVAASPRPAVAQGQGVIRGAVFVDSNRNSQQDPGEPPVAGTGVELWITTSIAGNPLRIKTTQTNFFGQYAFAVDAINGPLPDFGCYQVRVPVPASLGGGVAQSSEICQVNPNAVITTNFALPGSGGTPPPPGQGDAEIFGVVFRDNVRRNWMQEPGEPGVAGATLELWNTTSIARRPTRLQTTLTDSQGRYRFLVNSINGPLPDFGCYEVRLILASSLAASIVIRSQPICKIAAGGKQELDFPLAGGVIAPPVPTPPPPKPPAGNNAPAAIYIHADSGVAPGGVLRFLALGIDAESDCLTYNWSASGGQFVSLEGSLVDWQAPNVPGQYRIQARATDPQGRSVLGQVVVTVGTGVTFNHAPELEDIQVSTVTPAPGQDVQLSVQASDQDGQALTNWYHFYFASGVRTGPNSVIWRAPSTPGIYRVYGVVRDPLGAYGFNFRELSVNSAQALNRSHPSYGRFGQLLIESFGRLLWVGINDPQVAQQAAALTAGNAQYWVVGRVVPDSSQRHCFYLDPNTVGLAEITIEAMQTTVEQVSRRPQHFAPGGGGGFDAWALSARLIQFVPAQ